MAKQSFFNRDLSWLSFNERVLMEAANPNVPLLERISFLSIYSSNLDEFYRVRIPALMALHKIHSKDSIEEEQKSEYPDVISEVRDLISHQLEEYGRILTGSVLPGLREQGVHLLYNEPLPEAVCARATAYFYAEVLAFLQPVPLKRGAFFPENNKLYMAVLAETREGNEQVMIVNIPSEHLPRFHSVQTPEGLYILFLDDLIRAFAPHIFPSVTVKGCYSFKINRDAEMELEDEYSGDIAEKIEKQVQKRDFGLATRFLYDPRLPLKWVEAIIIGGRVGNAIIVEGGVYHNLKDFASLPVKRRELSYEKLPALEPDSCQDKEGLLRQLIRKDILVHTPYQSYNTVLRFFNEAAIDEEVTEIAVTLYRVASDSRIVNALISASKNGKKVTVFVELKARFDEVNNLKWSKRMKEAGIKLIYSIPGLKVHAKVALVKKVSGGVASYAGLLATGNLNESTARFYTDHILLTSNQVLMNEMEQLFAFLAKRERPTKGQGPVFQHLLVAQFNLQERFLELIDREIAHAQAGRPARITIKLNNLEERVLIRKLYEASAAGVTVHLIVRSICCLVPGVAGMSENITIKRIVDRFLEHGRVFAFHNGGRDEVYMGSADWMNRNIYRRIEVCFPIYNEELKAEMLELLDVQWRDSLQAVWIDNQLHNVAIPAGEEPVQSQVAIYRYLEKKLRGVSDE
ncbi:MAG TPA: polyphosphate kinase 1 [Chitinophagaceae bacterium]